MTSILQRSSSHSSIAGAPQTSLHVIPATDRWRFLRVIVMQSFLLHAFVFAAVMIVLLAVNLATWSGSLWMAFPLVIWSIVLAVHGGIAWLSANAGIADRMVDRAQQGVSPRRTAAVWQRQSREINDLLREGQQHLSVMRKTAKSISTRHAKREALATCSSAELVLHALREHPREVALAREFVHEFLEPATHIFIGYERLASRKIPSALPTLMEIEQQDLPRLRDRADALLERVHRGTMIDLDVAREMVRLNSRLPPPDDE